MLCNAMGYAMGRGAWCQISREKFYEGVRFNVISVNNLTGGGWM